MPLFEYKCEKCGKETEEFVKNCDVEVKCPVCGEAMSRVYSGKIYSATGKNRAAVRAIVNIAAVVNNLLNCR